MSSNIDNCETRTIQKHSCPSLFPLCYNELVKSIRHTLPVILPALVLSGFSLIVLGSISQSALTHQLLFLLTAVVIWYAVSRLDYRLLRSFTWVWYATANILLGLTLILGTAVRGSTRWINLGPVQFQPSEFAKPLIIIFFASFLTRYPPAKTRNFFLALIVAILPLFLIYRQPDLGSSLIVAVAVVSMIFSAGSAWYYILGLIGVTAIIMPAVWTILQPYQQQRVTSFLNPSSDPLGSGYNAIQSLIAVGSGMLIGKGLGQGSQSQLQFLPERQTDFIFAVISEEFGFLGSIIVVICYAILLYAILSISQRAKDSLGSLVCIGVFTLLLVQVFINIGMNTGIVPITGITLPLVSAGGSSVITTSILLGLVASVARYQTDHTPKLEIR